MSEEQTMIQKAFAQINERFDGIEKLLKREKYDPTIHPETIIWYKDESISSFNIVGELGQNSIPNRTNTAKVEIGTFVTSVGQFIFQNCSSLTSVTIPDSVITIGIYAFDGCSGLTSLTIPNSVTSIGNMAFSDCSNLRYVIIENGVTNINGTNIFQRCTSLTSINIPNSMTTIPQGLLNHCSSISSIIIPSSITSIESIAFQTCISLSSITCEAITAPTVKQYTFGRSNTSYTGRNTYNTGTNILKIPQEATGYTSSYWNSVLLNSSKCGFHIEYI